MAMADDRGFYSMTRDSSEEKVTLATLGTKMDTMAATLVSVDKNVRDLSIAQAKTEQSVKSSWHDINTLKKTISEIPETFNKGIKEHAEECIARERARNKAITSDSDTKIVRPDDSQIVPLLAREPLSQSNFNISKGLLKWMIIGFIILGAGFVGAGIVIGATVQNAPQNAGEILKPIIQRK